MGKNFQEAQKILKNYEMRFKKLKTEKIVKKSIKNPKFENPNQKPIKMTKKHKKFKNTLNPKCTEKNRSQPAQSHAPQQTRTLLTPRNPGARP